MFFSRDGCTALGALVALLLSAKIDAFTVCPATKSAARCRRTTELPSSTALAGSRWVGASSCTRSAAGPRLPTALSMADGDTPEVTVETLSNREFQLEELEDRDVMETSVVLGADGTVESGITNGPLPMSCQGVWSFADGKFSMDISRTFDAAVTPYTVRRTYEGAVDEMLPATDTLIMSGEITMDESKVGFFKMISAPSDILDSLKNVDERMKERASQ